MYNKKFRKLVSIIVLVVILAMVLTMVIPYLMGLDAAERFEQKHDRNEKETEKRAETASAEPAQSVSVSDGRSDRGGQHRGSTVLSRKLCEKTE